MRWESILRFAAPEGKNVRPMSEAWGQEKVKGHATKTVGRAGGEGEYQIVVCKRVVVAESGAEPQPGAGLCGWDRENIHGRRVKAK